MCLKNYSKLYLLFSVSLCLFSLQTLHVFVVIVERAWQMFLHLGYW